MIMEIENLPIGWQLCSLNDITKIIMGQSPPSSTYNTVREGLPFFQGKANFNDLYPTPRIWCSEPCKVANKDDVLISVRAPVGPTNLASEECCIGRGLASIRPLGDIDPKFILYLIRTFEKDLARMGTGSTFEAITSINLKQFLIPLPPLAEQRRIVAKIEKAQVSVNAIRNCLIHSTTHLSNFKASILKSGIFGELTRQWRNENNVEPASMLLESVNIERRKTCSTRMQKSIKKYNNPQQLEEDNLPILPSTWAWASLDQLVKEGCPIVYGVIKPGPDIKNGVPIVKVNNITDGETIDFAQLCKCAKDRVEMFPRSVLSEGDLLISKDGSIGRVGIVPKELEGGNITQHVIKVTVHPFIYTPYIMLVIQSPFVQEWLMKKTKGVALQGVNVEDFRKLPVSIPPYQEQQEIANMLNVEIAHYQNIETQILMSLKKTEQMVQSIFNQAFSGRLVPQDPNDEPASVLLDRIKADRTKEN